MSTHARPKLSKSAQRWQGTYGPWAVVTGASGGIGLEIAKDLAARGLNLVLAARSAAQLEAASAELTDLHGVETLCVAADLSQPAGFAALKEATDRLDVGLLVANAGFGTSGPFIDSGLDEELAMIDLNVRAVAEQIHHFANRFKSRKRAGVIVLSSIVSWQGVPKAANYAATKAWVQSFSEALHRELKPLGVDVLASAPAQVTTRFGARARMDADGADPAVVARNTVRALGRKATVYPHFMSWFLSTALSFLPRPVRVTILAGVMDGMTKSFSAPSDHKAG